MTGIDTMELAHKIICETKPVGEPTPFDLEVANASVVLHYFATKQIFKAFRNI